MGITKILKSISKHILPEVNVDKDNKYVELRPNFLGSNMAEAYYTLKRYEVKRI